MAIFNSLPKAFDFNGDSYKAGVLIGYLLNIKNYIAPNGSCTNISICADTSITCSNTFCGGMIGGITDIIDLHTKTLWLGNGTIIVKRGSDFIKVMSDYDIQLVEPHKFKGHIYCNAFIESLIFEFGFVVDKNPLASKVQIYPPIGKETELTEQYLKELCAAERKALKTANAICNGKESDKDEVSFDENEFIRGIRDGFYHK